MNFLLKLDSNDLSKAMLCGRPDLDSAVFILERYTIRPTLLSLYNIQYPSDRYLDNELDFRLNWEYY